MPVWQRHEVQALLRRLTSCSANGGVGVRLTLRRRALVLPCSVVVVIERFTRQLAVFAGSGSGLSSQVGVRSCEMADADEVKPAHAPLGLCLRERALLLIAACEQLLVDVVDAGLAQVL
ncbi:MAG: hypothetical protein QOF67_1400, partial [Mycobacterium sp.]|nr:hypothetical protein [Mycobacterium sp.]